MFSRNSAKVSLSLVSYLHLLLPRAGKGAWNECILCCSHLLAAMSRLAEPIVQSPMSLLVIIDFYGHSYH